MSKKLFLSLTLGTLYFELFVGGGKRDSYLPKEWREYFGIPAAEHENSYKIDLADGYITTDKV